jgi:nucleoside-diphosphate-sugar epimerase
VAPAPLLPRATEAPLSEDDLDELLTAPTEATVAAVSALDGDLMLLGAGGKMGPSLARLARRSIVAAGLPRRVICVSRFGSGDLAKGLAADGIETIACDLLERRELTAIPDVPNILYLAGFKFGATAAPHRTWAMNAYLPATVAERFHDARIVALSTGNVYPQVPIDSGGANEQTLPDPVGEYAQSCLARERMFEYMAEARGTRSVLVRLNYATDLRYGVLVDIAGKVHRGEPVDVSMGYVNTIWQGDANAVLLRAFDLCAAPPDVLNLTGPETLSVRQIALDIASLLGLPEPQFTGDEAATALLNDASRCHELYGPPDVPARTLVEWTASWVASDLPSLAKPTHFETRDGRF